MVRPSTTSAPDDHIEWDPGAGTIDAASLEGIDAVVHLAGKGIGDARFTERHKKEVIESRTRGTSLIATTLAGLAAPPSVLVSGSAVGFYGDRGDAVLDEESGPGEGFLPEVCTAWEASAAPARDGGIRTVTIRTGIVLSSDGGALGKVLPLFKLGLGGRIGHGRQYWPWISIDDQVRAIVHLITASALDGPVNLTAPNPVTNAQFTDALGETLHRPTLLPVPKFGPAVLLGREGVDEMLMASQRVVPKRLLDDDFTFTAPTIDEGFRQALA